MGLEAAWIAGPFHAAGEGYWQTVRRRGSADPTYFGGYAEVGMMLTPGDRRGYKDGAFDRIKPARPITEGGMQANGDAYVLLPKGTVSRLNSGYAASRR